LNKVIVIGENIQGQKFTTTFTTITGYTSGSFQPITFNYVNQGQPNCLVIGNIYRDDGVRILTPVAITDWSLNINKSPANVNINYIAGLAANVTYHITVLAL